MEHLLPRRIRDFLNQGDRVAAELPPDSSGLRRFVLIRPLPAPDVPREERRYLNSRYSMWQYWRYAVRRVTLAPGWEADEWNYDRYLVEEEAREVAGEEAFFALLRRWLPDPSGLRHYRESDCPI